MSSTDPSSDRVEELLARAERVVRQPVPPRGPASRVPWLLVGAGVVAVIVLIAALTSGGSSGVSGQTTAVPLASTTSAVATTTPIVITLPPNTARTTTTVDDTTTTPTTTQGAATTTAAAPAFVPRTITAQGGSLVLQGTVADRATADAIRAALAASFGASAVIDQFQVVAGALATDTVTLSAGTAVKFAAGQTTTDVASLKFLDQLADMLVRNPGVTADVQVSADAGGEALARQRAGVVRQYLSGHGPAAERLTSAAVATTGPAAQLIVVLHHLPG
jgi:outer membrane protein OmpA-like peptidoglycan-associated protein